MSIVTLAQAKAQGRITWSAEDDLIQGYLEAAEMHACAYLNAAIYSDLAALVTAQAAALAEFTAAEDTWNTAQSARLPAPDVEDAATVIFCEASAAWDRAVARYTKVMRGSVVEPRFVMAVQLLVQGWFANRENMTLDMVKSVELPEAFRALLYPMREQMGV